MKYLFSIVLLSLVVLGAQAQQKPLAPAMQRPTASMQRPNAATTANAIPKDTVKLKAAFKELFPLIKPAQTVKERTDMALKRMDRMFKMQGIDSVKAHDSVMAAINQNQDEEILFNAYADNFTPDEIKSIATFFKSPAGKHYMEVEQRLLAARQQTDQYINRTISMVTMPMRKPITRPGAGDASATPGAPGMPPRPRPGMRPGMRPGQTPDANAPAAPAPAPTTDAPQH